VLRNPARTPSAKTLPATVKKTTTMIYSERQLESFSTPPFKYETKQIIRTKDAIQEVLREHIPTAQIKESFNLSDFKYDIYLQGSYKNSTNISKSSDVDIVIELTSVYFPNTQLLNENDKRIYDSSRNPSKYRFAEFKNNVHSALVAGFGNRVIIPSDKCIKLIEHDNFCNADIVPCFTHKKFTMFESYSKCRYYEGIEFITDSGHTIINYPHQHYTELTNKSSQTSGRFKETVRMFKTLREELIDNGKIGEGVAKSYYIENLLFNLPNEHFAGSYRDRFLLILNTLITDFNNGNMLQYKCANGFQKLISAVTWSSESAKQFLLGLIFIRDNNEF
jgi:hypothetical protein